MKTGWMVSQRVAVSGLYFFTWKPVTTAVVEGSAVPGPSLVYFCISNLTAVMECTLQGVQVTKLEGPVNTVTRARLPAVGWRTSEIQKGQMQLVSPGIIPGFSVNWRLPGQGAALLRRTLG